jgi:hypothetical protein
MQSDWWLQIFYWVHRGPQWHLSSCQSGHTFLTLLCTSGQMNNYHADSTTGLWIQITIGAEHLIL